jgi:hypothetical protein
MVRTVLVSAAAITCSVSIKWRSSYQRTEGVAMAAFAAAPNIRCRNTGIQGLQRRKFGKAVREGITDILSRA